MKKALLILLCFPLIFSCGDDKSRSSKKSEKNITECLAGYDWCEPNCNNPTAAWKFSSDGTFNYSTTMFGGMSTWGNWKETDGSQIEITYTKTSTGDILPNKILSMPDCNSLKVGSTIYKR